MLKAILNEIRCATLSFLGGSWTQPEPKYRIDGWAVYDFNDDFVSFQPELPAVSKLAENLGYCCYPATMLIARP